MQEICPPRPLNECLSEKMNWVSLRNLFCDELKLAVAYLNATVWLKLPAALHVCKSLELLSVAACAWVQVQYLGTVPMLVGTVVLRTELAGGRSCPCAFSCLCELSADTDLNILTAHLGDRSSTSQLLASSLLLFRAEYAT